MSGTPTRETSQTHSRLTQGTPEHVRVPVAAIREADSPRSSGVDLEHARYLAQVDADLPPIVVDRATMRVIDGMHRLTAARLNGEPDIDVRFFEGDQADAFLLAVRLNVSHGMPLSLADRRSAAARIIRTHPQLSDRAIARTTGLAAKTIAALRRRTESPGTSSRVGLDGRARPVDAQAGREAAARLLAERPNASLREIAREAGISAETVRSVRERVRAGEDPVADRRSGRARTKTEPARQVTVKIPESGLSGEVRSLLENLRRDPSLRYTDTGRGILTWLAPRVLIPGDFPAEPQEIPPHCRASISALARTMAAAWVQIALRLEDGS